MTDHDLFTIASVVGHQTVMVWLIVAFVLTFGKILSRTPPRLVGAVFHELRPFYLPATAVAFLADSMLGHPNLMWRLIVLGINLWNWWQYKDAGDDDDRWKRRRKRLAERVSEVAGRLTVVPARAEA